MVGIMTIPGSSAYQTGVLAPLKPGTEGHTDAYRQARRQAEMFDLDAVVDVGLGNVQALVSEFWPDFDVIGLAENDVARLRQDHPVCAWHELGQGAVAWPDDDTHFLIVSFGVAERLADPDVLAGCIREGLQAGGRLAMLSVPNRLEIHGFNHPGPPLVPGRVREWTPYEFLDWLEDRGLEIVHYEPTKLGDGHSPYDGILAYVTA